MSAALLDSLTTIPALILRFHFPFFSSFYKSPHFVLMPQFEHNHSISSSHILNYIPDLFFFCLVLQSCPLSFSSCICPPPSCNAVQPADAKSLRDPSKIKAMRLQVSHTFNFQSLLQDCNFVYRLYQRVEPSLHLYSALILKIVNGSLLSLLLEMDS